MCHEKIRICFIIDPCCNAADWLRGREFAFSSYANGGNHGHTAAYGDFATYGHAYTHTNAFTGSAY